MTHDNATDAPHLAGEEECIICHAPLGYPKMLNIHHPKRLGNYVEGSGQVCQECAARLDSNSVVPIYPFE